MIEECVFDFVTVGSKDPGEIGKHSDAVIDIAISEKGEHCLYRSRSRSCLNADNHSVDEKTFQFFCSRK